MSTCLSDEIYKKEALLLEEASAKEKYCYAFLKNKPCSFSDLPESMGEIDKICAAAFCNGEFSTVIPIIEAHRQMKKRNGLHFTDNLIQICAFAKCCQSIAENELKIFFDKHGILEQWIIVRLFPNFQVTHSQPKNEIESLIYQLFVQNQQNGVLERIVNLLGQISELIELFVIQKAFMKLCELHPNALLDAKYQQVANINKNLIAKLEKIINFFIAIVFFIFMAVVIIFFVKKWDEWKIEPILTAMGVVGGVGVGLNRLGIRFSSPLEKWNQWILKKIFPNYYELKNIIGAETSE